MLTGTNNGAYSAKFHTLEQERLSRMKDGGVEHAQQMAARERARKLSLETNRRRKALETKKKLEAQKEVKRRHEVLEERRQRQREATIKYQRLNKGNKRHTDHNTAYGTGTPSLDDVLQMVGAPSTLSLKYGQGQASRQSNGMSPSYTYPATTQYSGLHIDSNANITTGVETRGHAKLTHSALTPATPLTRVDSRSSQFELELAEQQKQLLKQQQKSLQEFNQVIQSETQGGHGGENLQRSNSLSSVDSLEDQPRPKTDNQKDREGVSRLESMQDTGTFAHKQFESQNMQTTTPSYDQIINHANYGLTGNTGIGAYGYGATGMTAYSSGVDHTAPPAPPQVSRVYSAPSNSNWQHSNLYPSDQINSTVNGTASEGSHAQLTNNAVSKASHRTGFDSEMEVKSTVGDANSVSNHTSQAWSASNPSTSRPQQHGTNATTSASQRSRPYSARTKATAVTIAPAVSYPLRTHDSQAKHNGLEVDHQSPGTSDTTVDVQPKPKPPSQIRKGEDQKPQTVAEPKPKVVSPKSILKRPRSDPPARERKTTGVAAAVVKDSLEIGKKCGVKSPKKGVRWTDLKYSDDEDGHATEETDTATPARKPKLVSSVNARTVQEHLGDGLEQSNKSTPSRPKSGRPNSAKASGGRSENPRFPQGTITKHNQNGKEREEEKSTVVTQNGIRLDKTPTDDEINWLWDKVRTCLNTRDESNGSDAHSSAVNNNVRHASAANHVTDQRITANLRVAPPANKPRLGTHRESVRKQNTVPRWRTSSDSGSHLRRTTLLQQRRPQGGVAGSTRNSSQPQPASSHQGPSRSAITSQQPYDQEVTDSLMAFQQAEQLVHQDADEVEIAAVIEQQHQQPMHQQKAHPSALSIEEQKILESLDRLNARLKTVTAEVTGAFNPVYPMMPPRPPSYGGGFRGHRPLSSRPGVNGVVRPSHRVRAHSADRSSVRMGHHR